MDDKKYNEALERAKVIIKDYKNRNLEDFYIHMKENLERIFPELAESEDEKIRKGLIKHLQELRKSQVNLMTKDTYDLWIAWLEKQDNINATKLTSEIKRIIECSKTERDKVGASQIDKLSLGGRIVALEELLSFINSLSQDNQ